MICFALVMPNLSNREIGIVSILTFVAIIAHLLNLGVTPLMADEAIRANVAWEMIASKNYIVPTMWGDFYYRKPPLYNWVIIGFFQAFNSYSEFVFRLPSVIPLFILSFATWFVSRNHIGERAAAIAAFGFLLSGRLLTRDSLLGHIDIAFSLVTFIGFFTVYHFHKKKNFWALFLISYVLAAIGVLMKGLPSFLFQGFTVGLWLIYQRDWKKLFSLSHFAGIAVFLLIVVGYFYTYSQYNSLETYFDELYGQAAMRTVVDKPWYEGVLNIFVFPFENFGHLFPTSLLLIFMFRKGTIKRWMSNDFMAFVLLTLAINVLPYWLSPGYYPRYLFMLYPLVFILGAESFIRYSSDRNWMIKSVEWLFFAMAIILLLAFVGVSFIPELQSLDYLIWAAIIMTFFSGVIIWLWFKQPQWRVYWSFAVLISFRLGFDLFVLPYRMLDGADSPAQRKIMAEKILANTPEDWPIKVFDQAPIYKEHDFYLGVATNRLIEKTTLIEPNCYYLVDDVRLKRVKELESIHSHKMCYKDYDTHVCQMTALAREEFEKAKNAPTE
jgi:4-amino-4-deoxy-L-arabinose transferase-like glycosyltransferase